MLLSSILFPNIYIYTRKNEKKKVTYWLKKILAGRKILNNKTWYNSICKYYNVIFMDWFKSGEFYIKLSIYIISHRSETKSNIIDIFCTPSKRINKAI